MSTSLAQLTRADERGNEGEDRDCIGLPLALILVVALALGMALLLSLAYWALCAAWAWR